MTKDPGRLFDIVKNDDPAKDKLADAQKGLKAGKITTGLADQFMAAGLPLPDDAKPVANGPNYTITFKPASGVEREVVLRAEGPTRLSAYKLINTDDKDEADVIWRLNMMQQLGVSQHNMCSCSVTAVGDVLYVNTSNGVDEGHVNLPAPTRRPSWRWTKTPARCCGPIIRRAPTCCTANGLRPRSPCWEACRK